MSFSWMSFCAKFLVVAVMVVVVGCCLLTFKKNQGEQTKRSKYLRRLSLAFNGRRPTQRRVVHFLFVWAKCADKESHIPAAINDTRNRGAFLQKTTPDTHMDDRQTPRHQAHTHTHLQQKCLCGFVVANKKSLFTLYLLLRNRGVASMHLGSSWIKKIVVLQN